MLRQGIREPSALQKYPIGYRYAEGGIGERAFRYSLAADTLKALMGGRCTNFPREGNTDNVAYPAGTNQITIPMNPNGDNFVAEQLADYWKDGYIWIQQGDPAFATGIGQMFRIKSSAAAVGGFVVLTLEDSLKVAVEPVEWITAWPNIYRAINTDPDVRMSVVCIPLIPVPSGHYFWGQTWGPIFMVSGQMPGRVDYDRTVYFNPTPLTPGQQGITPGRQIDFSTLGNPVPQRAGTLITNTNTWTPPEGADELGGDQFFMLELAP